MKKEQNEIKELKDTAAEISHDGWALSQWVEMIG